MWIKDSRGNWFVSEKNLIGQVLTPEIKAIWIKDGNGNWYMADETTYVPPVSDTGQSEEKLAS